MSERLTPEAAALRLCDRELTGSNAEDVPAIAPAAIRSALAQQAQEWREALASWAKCSSKRLSWASGGHCSHCAPLRALMKEGS